MKSQAEQMSKENDLPVEINQAYIDLVGAEYATANDCQEAFQGEYKSAAEFAQEMFEETDSTDTSIHIWPFYCIDWEWAARELMYDYMEQDGYYFRNL